MPVTNPAVLIVAIDVALLVHVPPPVASLNRLVKSTHTLAVPVIAAGPVFTVSALVDIHPVGNV